MTWILSWREFGELTLKGMRFKLLKTFSKLSQSSQDRLKMILAVAKNTAKAHEAKESLVAIMNDKTLDKETAKSSLSAFCEVLAKSGVNQVKTLAKTLKANLDSIANYFSTRVTNAAAEGANSRIKKLIANANGIGSVEALRSRVLFFCGGLSLLPDGLPFFFNDF
jgi:transposase